MRLETSRHIANLICIIIVWLSLLGCENSDQTKPALFSKINSKESGLDFTNALSFNKEFNIYTYRNFYNGGGVAIGDINNDGLVDIYLTANMASNRLYLNKGNFVFEDITDKARVGGSKAWSTGVSMADVNGDGLLDIYVCNSGDIEGDNKENELFINNGNLTFIESARQYGIADQGFTTHAAFFDYDHDNDLDLYILNNSYQAIGSFNLMKNERNKRDVLGGDKLMRNDNGHFTDVSDSAGIYGSVIGFGLGVTVGDINLDGWIDIYVSNDFFERDYLYLNNQDGTFREVLPEQMRSISGASMGADLADINNDGYPDIFVTEMLPADNSRIKTVTTFENWDRYQYAIKNGYYHQFTRNMLQLNNGNGTFSEIGRLCNVEATDWSWGALMFDVDNDGLKDLFVANGIYQDVTNQDYLQYVSNEEVIKSIISNRNVNYKKLVDLIPSTPISNFAFKNLGSFQFENKTKDWGLDEKGFSNGAAYGDLDNDGDLDLIINNVNSPVSLYRNNSRQQHPGNHYLKFRLTGKPLNSSGTGASIKIIDKDQTFYVEQMPNRGFESSVDPRPNIGVGPLDTVEMVIVTWPDGDQTTLKNIATNQVIELTQGETSAPDAPLTIESKIDFSLVNVVHEEFVHKESEFVDFDRDKLVFQMISNEGPRLALGDVNNDNRTDFYIGGAKGQAGAIFVQTKDGRFSLRPQKDFENDRDSEDIASSFFDADGDGDQDLYVCSGSNEYSSSSFALVDRLYINDGGGKFVRAKQVLPTAKFESTSIVTNADFDKDGDQDLFVGVRSTPSFYGTPVNGYILINDGKGNFRDETSIKCPGLSKIGMITDASWGDIDGDRDDDLVIVGEYMPVKIFVNDNGKFTDFTVDAGLDKTNGWWNRIKLVDLDNDGDLDFIAGNHGRNSRFKASYEKPIRMYTNDFDHNGDVEQIICEYQGDKSYPMVLRHDLTAQIPSLKKKYLKYENYKDQTISNIFSETELANAVIMNAYELSSSVFINDGHGKFEMKPLPVEAQFSTVMAISTYDFNNDGSIDILLGGNLYRTKPEVGRYDASYGVLLLGNGKGDFKYMANRMTGLQLEGEVRDIQIINDPGLNSAIILVARNNDSLLTLKVSEKH